MFPLAMSSEGVGANFYATRFAGYLRNFFLFISASHLLLSVWLTLLARPQ